MSMSTCLGINPPSREEGLRRLTSIVPKLGSNRFQGHKINFPVKIQGTNAKAKMGRKIAKIITHPSLPKRSFSITK